MKRSRAAGCALVRQGNGFWFRLERPKQIVMAVHRETAKIVAMPEMKVRLAMVGIEPVASSPEEFASQIGAELPNGAI